MIYSRPREVAIAWWAELLIFTSSYFPLFLILFIRDIGKDSLSFSISYFDFKLAAICALISAVSSLWVCSDIRKRLTSQQGGTEIRVKRAERLRGDILNYNLPFLIGLFAFDFMNIWNLLSLFTFLGFMFAFVHKERLSLLNPMFLLLGVRLYKIEHSVVGNENTFEKDVLCLGEVLPSVTKIKIKDVAGISFIFK